MSERTFDPNKARRIGADGEVENVPFTEMQTQGNIFRDLQSLGELLKGANADDYDTVFGTTPGPWLQRYKDLADQMSMNLERIIGSKRKKE